MNIENINKLIAFMEAGTLTWNMNDYYGCFCGQARRCFDGGDHDVAYLLGIDDSSELIMPRGWQKMSVENIYTRDRAIAQLKHLRDTGEINWSATP